MAVSTRYPGCKFAWTGRVCFCNAWIPISLEIWRWLSAKSARGWAALASGSELLHRVFCLECLPVLSNSVNELCSSHQSSEAAVRQAGCPGAWAPWTSEGHGASSEAKTGGAAGSGNAWWRARAHCACWVRPGAEPGAVSAHHRCSEVTLEECVSTALGHSAAGLLTSGRRRTILQKVGLMLLLLHARTNLYWRFCQTLSGSLKALLSPKPSAMAKELLLGAVLAVTGGFADQVLRYQAKLATLELWSGAMGHLQRKLLREHTLLRVSQEVGSGQTICPNLYQINSINLN